MGRGTVVTFGEGLIRFTPPGGTRMTGARSFTAHPGGAEANVAVGLASLGTHARWFSRLPGHAFASSLLHDLRATGVDTSTVLLGDGRLGTYYLEPGAGIRPSSVIYDREASSFSRLQVDHLTDATLDVVFQDATWLHTTGINLSIANAPVAAVQRMWDEAGRRGVKRSFDVNLRASLPEASALLERATPMLGEADVVLVAERDVCTWMGQPRASMEAILATLGDLAPHAVRIVTRGAGGATGVNVLGERTDVPALESLERGRIGRGDAFAAGVLHVLSQAPNPNDAVPRALRWGVACASYKSTLDGDLPRLDGDVIARLLEDGLAADVQR